jgi:hypothetical protein
MRPQAKPFTVQRKRKKHRAGDRSDFDFLGLNRVFGPPRSETTRAPEPVGGKNPVGNSGPVQALWRRPDATESSPSFEARPVGTRVLPDLTATDHWPARKAEDEVMASKPRKTRRQTKDRTASEIKKRRRRVAKPSAQPEKTLISQPEQRISAEPVESQAPAAESSAASVRRRAESRSPRRRASQDLSPRELRRAIARGAVKLEDKPSFGRNRDLPSQPRRWSSLANTAKRGF